MSCGFCRQTQADGFRKECPGLDYVDACPTGEVPKLSPVNREFVALFVRMLPGLSSSTGGYDYNAIKVVMDIHGVPVMARPEILDKVISVIMVMDAERQRRNERT